MTSRNRVLSCRAPPQVHGKIAKLVKEGKYPDVGAFVKFAVYSALEKREMKGDSKHERGKLEV